MKRLFLVLLICLGIICLNLNPIYLTASSGDNSFWQVVTSSGITAIYFTRKTTEIFVIKKSTTGSVYINWTSTFTVAGSTTTFELREGVVDWQTEEIQSTEMSI